MANGALSHSPSQHLQGNIPLSLAASGAAAAIKVMVIPEVIVAPELPD